MTFLWLLWLAYCLAFFTDLLYVQPYRRRKAAQRRVSYAAGSVSFGLRAALPLFTLVLLARTFVWDIFHIPSPSMEPNLKQGATIWVNRMAYGLRSPLTGQPLLFASDPQPGEIIVFHYPREPRTTFVKRVLGVPGDHILISGDNISVNGLSVLDPEQTQAGATLVTTHLGDVSYQLLDDPLIRSDVLIDLVVPKGHYFALGDNINHSEDSRSWGLVASRHLIGRVYL